MTWYGVFVTLFISVCFTANIKAQEPVTASAGPENCSGMEKAFYSCMLLCFQDDHGYEDFTESDICSEDIQAAISQLGGDSLTLDNLNDALECITGRCRSVIPPSICQDSSPPIINLPEATQKEIMSGIKSGKYKDLFGSQSEKKAGSSELKSGQLNALGQLSKQPVGFGGQTLPQGATGLLSEVLKASGIQPGKSVGVPGLQPDEVVVSGTPELLEGFGSQFPGLDASGLVPDVPGAPGLQPGQLVVSGLQPGQLDGRQDASTLLLKIMKAAGIQPEELGGGQDTSTLLLKFLRASGIQPDQPDASDLLTKLLNGSGEQIGQLGALGQGMDASGMQPGQSVAVSGPQSEVLASGFGGQSETFAFASASGDNIAECDDNDKFSQESLSLNNPAIDSSNIQLTSSATSASAISGTTPASLTGTTSDLSTSGITTGSGVSGSITGSSTSSENGSTLSTDSTSDLSVDDCDDFDGSQSNIDENSNSFFQFAEAVASAGNTVNSSLDDSGFFIDDCYYYYDDYNGTFSNCSFYNESFSNSSFYDESFSNSSFYDESFSNSSFYDESFSNSSDYYGCDNSSDNSNYDISSAFTEAQIIIQNSGIQQYQSNNEDASSISLANGQNEGEFANAAALNPNPNTGQDIGIMPSGSNQAQSPLAAIPAQNQGQTIQQFQNNNNGFGDLNYQNLGLFGNAPVAGQSINQGQFQSPGSRIPAVQQYQSTNNGGGVAIGSGQNPSQFVNSFLQGFNQYTALSQNGNGFSANQQYPAQITAAGNGGLGQGINPYFPAQFQTALANNFAPSLPLFNSAQNGANIQQFNGGGSNLASNTANAGGSLSQTQGGLSLNVPAGNNFGTGPTSNFQQNSGNAPPYNMGGNMGGVANAVSESGISNQGQSSSMSIPMQSSAFSGSNFGTGPTLNFQQNSGNAPSYNMGGNNPSVASAVAGSGISNQGQSSSMNNQAQSSAFLGSNFGSGNAPQTNVGGIGQNANNWAINNYASSGASAGFMPEVSTNNQPLGGSFPFSQGLASDFGSPVNAQAQASAG